MICNSLKLEKEVREDDDDDEEKILYSNFLRLFPIIQNKSTNIVFNILL